MLQRPTPPLILASSSTSRQAVLLAAGLTFATRPAQVDEGPIKQAARAGSANAEDTALLLAELKAREIALREPAALVIGADQILVCNDEWFDKPSDPAGAAAQLRALRGRTHVLVTAVLCQQGDQRLWHHVARPRLTMRRFSDGFLEAYLAAEGEDVTTTVGAYRLEGRGVQLFDCVEGEHAAVLGMPLLDLLGFMRQHGLLVT
jgi:septum formation protein